MRPRTQDGGGVDDTNRLGSKQEEGKPGVANEVILTSPFVPNMQG